MIPHRADEGIRCWCDSCRRRWRYESGMLNPHDGCPCMPCRSRRAYVRWRRTGVIDDRKLVRIWQGYIRNRPSERQRDRRLGRWSGI